MSKQEELLDVVDENDKIIEKRIYRDCVHLGLLHRAIVVILLDSTMTRTFIQKRSERKTFFAGLWSASCTGHVASGESYAQGATREVEEELGLGGVKLEELFKFLSPKWRFGDKTEWEYITVFEGNSDDRKITLQEEEVQEGKYISFRELSDLLNTSEKVFTPDSVIAFRGYKPLHNVG